MSRSERSRTQHESGPIEAPGRERTAMYRRGGGAKRHHRADGGIVPEDAGGNPSVMREAEREHPTAHQESNRGGPRRHRRKNGGPVGKAGKVEVGRMNGGAVAQRGDKPRRKAGGPIPGNLDKPGRKTGGRVGADRSPLSSAHRTGPVPPHPSPEDTYGGEPSN